MQFHYRKWLFLSFILILVFWGCEALNRSDEQTPSEETENIKELVSFKFTPDKNSSLKETLNGVIAGNGVYITFPYGTDRTALIPEFEYFGTSLLIDGTVLNSGSSPADFTHEMAVLTITGNDSTSKDYSMQLKSEPALKAEIIKKESAYVTGPFQIDLVFNQEIDTESLQNEDLFTTNCTISKIEISDNSSAVVSITPDKEGKISLLLSAGSVTNPAASLAVLQSETLELIYDITPPVSNGILKASKTYPDSLTLGWNNSTDNFSATDTLQYKIVMAKSDLFDSIDAADIDSSTDEKKLIQRWELFTGEVEINGLDSGTDYYFVLLVKDEAGNRIKNTTIQLKTQNLNTFSINFITPVDESIHFDKDEEIGLLDGESLQVKILENFETYSWYLDGNLQESKDSFFNLSGSTLELGNHTLSCFVTNSKGKLYAKNLIFRKINSRSVIRG